MNNETFRQRFMYEVAKLKQASQEIDNVVSDLGSFSYLAKEAMALRAKIEKELSDTQKRLAVAEKIAKEQNP